MENRIILRHLSLQDWRGQSKSIDFSEGDNILSGENKSGKSTIFNAWLWLLLGTDEYDRSNFQLFDNTVEQNYENSKTAIVEALIDINGNPYKLKKEASIGWSRSKGSFEYTRKGSDSYKFFIDDIELSALKYKSFIEENFAPIDKLKIMVNIRYFLGLDWKEMRKILGEIAGEIKNDDFKGDYSIISDELKKHSPSELKTSYMAQRREIKKSIDSLPISIEALKSNLPDIDGCENAQKEIEDCEKDYKEAIQELQGKKDSIKQYVDKRNNELREIEEMEDEYRKSEKEYNRKFNAEILKLEDELDEICRQNEKIELLNRANKRERELIKQQIVEKEKELDSLKSYRETLLSQNEAIKSYVFDDTECPYCGQQLPDDKLEEGRKKFNENKEKKRKAIVDEGKSNNIKIQACLESINSLNEQFAKIPNEETEAKSTKEIEEKMSNLKKSHVEYYETNDSLYKRAEIENKKENLTIVPNIDDSGIKERISEIALRKERALKIEVLKKEYDRQETNIKGKQEELKANSVALAVVEGKIAKLAEYEREYAEIVSRKVSSHFDYVSVQMSDVNKSGEIIDTCIIKDSSGVNALVTNNASRILCGIDIALAFQEYYQTSIPLFIDNAESVNDFNMPVIGVQTIKMYVSDSELKIEKL